jgi:DNA-directed RNA polymerase specialized sigma24 family protein
MADRVYLHLVDDNGVAATPVVREAIETAFRWVQKDYPNVDRAQIANWAESLAESMQRRGSAIESPARFAYAALNGKVRDWLRLRSAQEHYVGVDVDLERIGGNSHGFVSAVERKILFDQLLAALPTRDRSILVLLLAGQSGTEIAEEMRSSYPAMRKAIQRLRERATAILNGERIREEKDPGPAKFYETKGIGF